MSGPCPNCHRVIHGPNHYTPPQPQPLNPPQEEVPTLHPQPPEALKPRPAQAAQPRDFESTAQLDNPPQQPEPQSAPRPTSDETDFRENKPESILGSPPSRKERASGLSFLQAFVLCFFSSLIFFVLGFSLGKSGAVEWSSLREKAQQQQTPPPSEESTSPAPEKKAEIPLAPLTIEPTEQTEELTTARATLEAFLAADTLGARNAYCLNSDEILPMMAASAAIHGDEPIPFDSISLHTEGPSMRVFWVETAKHPLPFSVVMLKEDDWWLVDWPGFADFYYDRLGAFARGREGPMKGTFRILLKPAPGETSPLSPSRCLVKAPQSPSSYQVNSPAESPARRELAEIFQAYQQEEPEGFKEAISGDGIPLIVEISRTGATPPTLQLDQVITTGWPPLPSLQLKKDSSSRFY